MHLDIIFRSCSSSTQKRYIESSKGELSLTCLNTILSTIRHATQNTHSLSIKLHILDDHSEQPFIDKIHELLKRATCENYFTSIDGTGQSASMQYSCLYAKEYCHHLIYFVEDDYLHSESALLEMLEAYDTFSLKLQREVIISPCDHVTEYRPPDINTRGMSRIVLGTHRHWRTTYGTTSTYLINRSIFDTYFNVYMAHANYTPKNGITENNTINLIYQQEICFSPIPSLTAHISHLDLQPPFFDYQSLWTRYFIRYP